MAFFRFALLATFALPCLALAQQPTKPPESITVTAPKDQRVIDNFIQSNTAPTAMIGKVARWEEGVCPITVGLAPKFSAFVSQHIRDVAARINAPVNRNPSCKPNIEIVFTTTPQGLANTVRRQDFVFLGYAKTMAQVDKLAVVSHVIQAWYTTSTKGIQGGWQVDNGRSAQPTVVAATGNRARDGLHSTLYHVIIAAEPAKLLTYEMGTLAVYIAMLALAQMPSLESCRPLASIVNLLATDCPGAPSALTASDMGYLKGLYAMDADSGLNIQRAGSRIKYGVKRGNKVRLGIALLLLSATVALAQPAAAPTENVTVSGTRSREVMQDFVRSMAVPTHTIDKLARWNDGICPLAAGLRPGFAEFIVQRLREVAMQTGAPVNEHPSCKPNIEIAFTAAPQALMDRIKIKNSVLLGYHDNREQRDQLAKVTHPIQAWYTTLTQDLRGNQQVDSGKTAGLGMEIVYLCNPGMPGMICTMHLPGAHAASVTGSRLGDGQRSGFYHVLIVVDPSQLRDYGMGALADYIAMLALTQVASLDACRQLPSIVNLLAKDCDRKSDALTANDAAHLRGLYKMGADRTLRTQRDEIAYQMEQSLGGGEGK